MKSVTVSVSGTWRPPVSAAPGAAGPPSLLSPPQTRVSSPPAPCAEPPGSSSSAHDAAEATDRQTDRTEDDVSTLGLKAPPHMQSKKTAKHELQNLLYNTIIPSSVILNRDEPFNG